MPDEILKLGGRSFRSIGIETIEHDLHFWRNARRAGLHEERRDGEGDEECAVRLLGQMIDSGVLIDLVADMLVPVEVERWSPEVAAETARWIEGLGPSQDWPVLRGRIVSLLMAFFVQGSGSLANTRARSSGSAEARP